MMNERSNHLIAVQVATEAIINEDGHGYEQATMRAVWDEAQTVGVAPMYIEMLAELIVW